MMDRYLLISSVFFVSMNGLNDNRISFSRDVSSLSHCIEGHNLFFTKLYYENPMIRKLISHLIAKRFSGKTEEFKDVKEGVRSLIYHLQFNDRFGRLQLPWNRMPMVIMKALMDCSDDNYGRIERTPLPSFEYEPQEVGDFLDFILVDWPTSLFNMIRTRDDRALLRRYVEDAEMMLENAHTQLDR